MRGARQQFARALAAIGIAFIDFAPVGVVEMLRREAASRRRTARLVVAFERLPATDRTRFWNEVLAPLSPEDRSAFWAAKVHASPVPESILTKIVAARSIRRAAKPMRTKGR